LVNLIINYCHEMTGFVDEGRAVCIVCLDFRKVFNTVLQQKVLREKLIKSGLVQQTMSWTDH